MKKYSFLLYILLIDFSLFAMEEIISQECQAMTAILSEYDASYKKDCPEGCTCTYQTFKKKNDQRKNVLLETVTTRAEDLQSFYTPYQNKLTEAKKETIWKLLKDIVIVLRKRYGELYSDFWDYQCLTKKDDQRKETLLANATALELSLKRFGAICPNELREETIAIAELHDGIVQAMHVIQGTVPEISSAQDGQAPSKQRSSSFKTLGQIAKKLYRRK